MSRKLLTVVGARPQFIKASAVSRALREAREFTEVLVHTGQHFDANMSAVFFEELAIPAPAYDLEVRSLPHGAMTGRMLERVEKVLERERPDAVLVYGDTNSTLAGALAARKLDLRVVHVEAGLRSFNPRMPEEINRVLTDRISDLLCCPTPRAVANLRAEGFDAMPCRVALTGDVMHDTALYYRGLAERRTTTLDRLGLRGRDFALCTLHRAENTDDVARLSELVRALHDVARVMPVVLPLHPRTAAVVKRERMALDLTVIDPVGYLDMVSLITGSRVVLTDSGGLQKEAFFFGRPCVTLRDETEWTELVEGGFNRLAGARHEAIVAAFQDALASRPDFSVELYGGGRAAANIVRELRSLLG